eukprot:CAMPEP_0197252370 /NCGR_PEP_ID=MMETSP1429-20130617/61139_1 /TAXON_ID=49237 /ORGANISM="Chaetoceros  sp., Strain UNC1202" /LENGTH=197 /DNA_ID=CAMNT_0042714741 /DNA_START=70 /DNA_END=663 /DNA_ORIENTATION=-
MNASQSSAFSLQFKRQPNIDVCLLDVKAETGHPKRIPIKPRPKLGQSYPSSKLFHCSRKDNISRSETTDYLHDSKRQPQNPEALSSTSSSPCLRNNKSLHSYFPQEARANDCGRQKEMIAGERNSTPVRLGRVQQHSNASPMKRTNQFKNDFEPLPMDAPLRPFPPTACEFLQFALGSPTKLSGGGTDDEDHDSSNT